MNAERRPSIRQTESRRKFQPAKTKLERSENITDTGAVVAVYADTR